MALLTPQQARELIPELRGEDALLATLIARAEQACAQLCRWPAVGTRGPTLEAQPYTFRLDGPSYREPRELLLPLRPVVSVESVHVDPSWTFGAGTLVPPSEYEVDGTEGLLALRPGSRYRWTSARRAIRVVAVCGLDPADVPPYVAQALAMTVRHLWGLRHGQGVQAAAQGGASRSRHREPRVVPADARALLSPLVLVELGVSGAPEVGYGG